MRISVLGLGKMGAPMARNLVEVGHEVTLYSRNPQRAKELAVKGGKAVATVREAAKDAQVALTMVSDDEAEKALTFGPEGLLAHLPPGAIHLCMGTIGVETSRDLALAHAEAGQGYVAAPVFGRPGTAASRQLWIMAGGPDLQVTRCLTLFDALGKGTTRVGPRAELAHALKLGGNLLTVLLVEGLSEVLAYGEKAGMEPAEYLRLLNTALLKSPLVDVCGGLIVRHLHDPADLTLDAALRDMRRTMEAAENLDAIMPAAEWLHERLEDSAAQGWGNQDLTVLARGCRKAASMDESESPGNAGQASSFLASAPEGDVELDLHKVTHFELIEHAVWAWTQGKRYRTPWKYLAEVERTFQHVPFLRLHRHILLQPEAALARRAAAGGAQKPGSRVLPEPDLPSPGASLSEPPADSRRMPDPVVPPGPGGAKRDAAWMADRGRLLFAEGKGMVQDLFERLPFPRAQQALPPPADLEDALGETGPVSRTAAPSARVEAPRPVMPNVDRDLEAASHFEVAEGSVWAWVRGTRTRTTWRTLDEIEAGFSHVVLVRIQRHILLHPEAVLAIKPAFGGRSKVMVAGGVELEASKAATLRLKEVLGL